MSQLNERQQEAVDTLEGPLLLLAGAGSGKTTVIVHRIANLVAHGIDPDGILAVTFTNKAAKEMRERIGKALGAAAAKKMTIATFHSFCVRVLRRHIDKLGYSRHFTISTESYQQGLIVEIMNQLGQVGKGYDAMLWRNHISMAKARYMTPGELSKEDIPKAAEVAQVYTEYQKRLQQMDLVDFDDLLYLTVKLWQEYPEVLSAYHDHFQRIMIDEYQDTNGVQLKLMTLLAGTEGNLAVVGDDDQSIYGWRGADITNILHFDKIYPNARVIRLEQNYRSTNAILKTANAVIAHNRERHVKNLWSQREEGEKVFAVRCEDDVDEAKFIVRTIEDRHALHGMAWRDAAVLYRSNKQSRLLEDEFRARNIPYVVVGATSFYQSKEILDAGAFLQAALNPKDDLSFLRIVNVPPRGIGDATIDRLRRAREITRQPIQQLAQSEDILKELPPEGAAALRHLTEGLAAARKSFETPGGLYDKARALLDACGYIDGMGRMYKPLQNAISRRDNVLELLGGFAQYELECGPSVTLQDAIDRFNLLDSNDRTEDKRGEEREGVTLMTVHASKGLEFPNVFVAGLERDLFPHLRAVEEGGISEERRLLYVAITRAQQRLWLTYALRRREGKILMPHPPSCFLDELPKEFVRFCTPAEIEERVGNQSTIAALAELLK